MVGAVQFPITQETIKKEKLLVVPSHRMCAFTNTVYGDFSHLWLAEKGYTIFYE